MPEFFTVDRRTTYRPGGTLELVVPQTTLEFSHAAKMQTSQEVQDSLGEWYPEGLSTHGHQYFLDKHLYQQQFIAVTPIVELVSELVRRTEFPDRPSRFQSFFGTESLEVAGQFRDHFGQSHHRVFKVECDSFFKADMKLLTLGTSNASAVALARKYWRGLSSDTPLWEILMVPPISVLQLVEPAT